MGASRGIGFGAAEALAREGARVALASRSADRLAQAREGIDGETAAFVADSSDLDRIARLPADVETELGPVDVLVLNTGGPPPGAALEAGREQWEAAYRDLVLMPRTLIEAALPGMRERGWGRIVNVASTSVKEPIQGLALSNVHRAATVGLLKTVATEVAAEGITANTIATGQIATDRLAELVGSLDQARQRAAANVPAGRLGTPEEYGDLVAFLCSERAGYLTGAVIPLDGGLLRST